MGIDGSAGAGNIDRTPVGRRRRRLYVLEEHREPEERREPDAGAVPTSPGAADSPGTSGAADSTEAAALSAKGRSGRTDNRRRRGNRQAAPALKVLIDGQA